MSNPSDQIAAEYNTRRVWTYQKVVGERDVITHVKCFLRVNDIPLLEAIAKLPAPDLDAFAEYWSDTENPLWTDMQDPAGFERPEFIMRDKLAPWAWSVLDRDALEAEGLAKWRAILAARQTEPAPDLAAELRALRERLDAMTAREPAPEPAPIEPETHFADLMLADETRDAELDALRARIAELEAAPILELSNDPPTEALMEAYPDEDHAALKARILAEFASLRNMLVGHIPMTMEQLARLQALEHPKFQTWLQA